MTNFEQRTPQSDLVRNDAAHQSVFVLSAVCAIFLAFALANSNAAIDTKTRCFSAIIAGFLLACFSLHIWQIRRTKIRGITNPQAVLSHQNEIGLNALAEAKEFFSGSIKAADTLRLVSSRVRALTPFRASALFLLDEKRSHLITPATDGTDIGDPNTAHINQCFSNATVEIDAASASVAVPLSNGDATFGVLCLYYDRGSMPSESDTTLFEAIGERVAPLFLSSIAREKSLSSAMTDSTTDMPNERAFFLVLENQIAETQRDPEARPLTILAADIRNFDDINQRFGHAAGDRILNLASKLIKNSLRQMDFLARPVADEFLIILPTATKEISHEVIARISSGFSGKKLKVNDTESVEIELNFGWAAFGSDGEVPNQLVAIARSRKDQAKSSAPNKVLWFPREFLN